MSTPPNFSTAFLASRSTSSLTVRSAPNAYTSRFPVSRTIWSLAREIESIALDEIATLQPSEARTFATPYPIPLLDAVTSATLPFSPRSIHRLGYVLAYHSTPPSELGRGRFFIRIDGWQVVRRRIIED